MKSYQLASLAIPCLVLAACDIPNPGKKAAAEANAVADILEVKQFAALFPNSDHFISHYSGTKGPSLWNSEVGVHGRYIVSLSFPIEFDSTRTRPKRTGPPEFYLREISKIETRADGSVAGWSCTKNQLRFGIEEWDRVVKAGGDLSVLGIEVITDKPIEHFDKAWHAN